MGSSLWDCLPLTTFILYHKPCGLSIPFFLILRRGSYITLMGFPSAAIHSRRGQGPVMGCPLLLYPYCITTWAVCQEVFYIFFEGCFVLHFRFRYSLPVCPLLLTSLLYHKPRGLSIPFLRFFFWWLEWELNRTFTSCSAGVLPLNDPTIFSLHPYCIIL